MGFWGSATDNVFGGGQAKASGDLQKGYSNSISTYNNILDKITKMYQPWMDRGNKAGDKMFDMGSTSMDAFNEMMGKGPGGTGDWQTEYQASPWAKYQTELGTQSAEAAAAAGGMLGSGSNQRDIDTMSQDISSKDRQQYFGDAMALQGAASGEFNPLMSTGAGMTQNLGDLNFGTGQEIGEAQQQQGQAKAMNDAAHSAAFNNMFSYVQNMFDPMGIAPESSMGQKGGGMSSGGGGGTSSQSNMMKMLPMLMAFM